MYFGNSRFWYLPDRVISAFHLQCGVSLVVKNQLRFFSALLFVFAAITVSASTVASVQVGGSLVGGSNQSLSGTVTISRAEGETGSVSVYMTVSGPIYVTGVVIPAGQTSAPFTLTAPNIVTSAQTGTVTAAIGVSQKSASVTVEPLTVSLSLAPSSVIGASSANSFTGTITLNAHLGSAQYIYLSDSPTGKTYLPGSVLFQAGQDSRTFTGQAFALVAAPVSVTITASVSTITGSATLSIQPYTISISAPSPLSNGETGKKTKITIFPAATATWPITFTITPQAVDQVGITFLTGESQKSAAITTSVSESKSVTITAQLTGGGPSATTTIQVNPKTEPTRSDGCEGCVGDPVNITTGNYWIEHRDYQLPGFGGMQIVRSWNSRWYKLNPIEQVGPFGYSWRSNLDERLQTLTGGDIKYWRADGDTWVFDYDSLNSVYHLTSPTDNRATLTYDALTTTRTITFRDGSQHVFNSGGYLKALIDRNGNTTTINLDANNRYTSVVDPASRTLTFTYATGTSRLVTTIADSVGTIASYTYGPNSWLTRVTYADGSQLNYDQNNFDWLITSVKDKDGKILASYTYDSNYRALTASRANNVDKVTTSYPSAGLARLTDSLSNVTDYNYDTVGGRHVVTAINGPGCNSCAGRGVNSFVYDSNGNRTSSTNAASQNTASTYDSNGNLLTRTVTLNGSPLTTTYTYNSFGQVLTATDPAGNVTTNTYDTHGNLLTTTTPSPSSGVAGSTTTFEYFPNGLLKKVTDPRNSVTQMTYTTAGLVETITDAQSNVTTFEYDARGNRTAVVDAANNRTTFEYYALNRLKKVTNPDTTHTDFAYDTRGRRTSVTDANGKVTTYAYDDADRLISVTDAQTPSAGVTTYAYDTENNLTSITDALNRATTFEYDARGRVTKTIFPSTLYETYNYDNLGNLLSKVDRKGQTITYGYDSLNRLTSKTLGSTGTVTYTYDNLGRLTQAEDATGTYGLAYDNLGRLTQTTTDYSFLPSQTFLMSYGYDAASNRTSFTDPQSGVTNYVYDTLNRLESLTNPQSQQFSFGYDNLSRRTSLGRPNGVTTSYTYDNLSRLLSVLHKNPAQQVIDGATYTVDNVGNRTSKQNHLAGATDSYSYDPIYQLTQVTRAAATTEFYNYDKVGNRTSSHLSASYATNSSNQLTATTSATYTYDNNGNTLSKTEGTDVTQYTWDYENRLTQVTLPNSSVVTFKYDPFGRRIQKSSAAGTINYLYDGANIEQELDASGTLVAEYTQSKSIDEPLAMRRSAVTFYYEADGLGSITSLSNSSGAISTQYVYDGFGGAVPSGTQSQNPFRYTGREFDDEIGIYYYRTRYYDQNVGRFLREDSARMRAGVNFFSYVLNSPTGYSDPLGLEGDVKFGSGYTGRVDSFNSGNGYEIHVYNPQGQEIGIVSGASGWIKKHGFSGTRPAGLPQDVINAINGLNVEQMRGRGILPSVFRGFKYLTGVLSITFQAWSAVSNEIMWHNFQKKACENERSPEDQWCADWKAAGRPQIIDTAVGPVTYDYYKKLGGFNCDVDLL
jgi:RHS repeat-associated protein